MDSISVVKANILHFIDDNSSGTSGYHINQLIQYTVTVWNSYQPLWSPNNYVTQLLLSSNQSTLPRSNVMKGNEHQRSNHSNRKAMPKHPDVVPGSTQYIAQKEKYIMILGDNIICGIRKKEFRKYIKVNVYFHCFQGSIAEDMFRYMQLTPNCWILEIALLHVGTNDLAGKDGQKISSWRLQI